MAQANGQQRTPDAAAQQALGNIRIELGAFRGGPAGARRLDSLLADLEARLKGANTETWRLNAAAAQQAVGNIRMELQRVARGL